MNKSARPGLLFLLLLPLTFTAPARRVSAASYFMVPDRSLIERTPVAVRAQAVQSRVVRTEGWHTETRTTFAVEDVLRGSA